MTPAEIERRLDALTPAQLAVLSGRCEGLAVREIADRLGYSEQRIYQHLAVIYDAFELLELLELNGYGRRAALGETICPVWRGARAGRADRRVAPESPGHSRVVPPPVALADEDEPTSPPRPAPGGTMKGVILAGGTATRLFPLTRVANKHLLPVYDKPMIFYPIEALVAAGIEDVMIVTGGNQAGDFLRLLGNGHDFGVRLQFSYQERPGGIAEALGLCETFVGGDKVLVLLGDNIFGERIGPYIDNFRRQERGARVLLKEIDDPAHLRHLGVPILGEGGRLQLIREKPVGSPPSRYAVTGAYLYDSDVFDIVRALRPSHRGELEITDVNNAYIDRGTMEYDVIGGFWGDCGESIDVYYQVVDQVRRHGANRPTPTSNRRDADEGARQPTAR